MKLFKLSDGRLIQVINKERLTMYKAEEQVIVVDFLIDKMVPTYGSSKDQAEIRAYLVSLLEEVAIPNLLNALKSPDKAKRISVAGKIAEISKSKPDMIKAVLTFIDDAENTESDKDVKELLDLSRKNYEKAQKRKVYEEKRKKMKLLDKELVSGQIELADYARERKEYLGLESEVGEE
jgi:hypothetical protein